MRLIDADVFIEYLGLDAENAREDNLGEIVTLEDFDRQPTAYGVDKFVERLEEEARCNQSEANELAQHGDYGTATMLQGIVKGYKYSADIVKSGGIE